MIPATGCMGIREITLVVVEPLTLDLGPDITTCADSVTLVAESNTAIRIFWAEDPDFMTIIDDGETFSVSSFGQMTYYAVAIDAAGCQTEASVSVDNQSVNVQPLQQDTFLCLGQSLSVSLQNLDEADTLAITWQPDEWIVGGAGTTQVDLLPLESGTQYLSYEISNQYGCNFSDSCN